MSHKKNESRRAAYRFLVMLIDDFHVRYMEGNRAQMFQGDVPAEVRAELDELKDTFANAGTIKDADYPPEWTPGDPPVGGCNCNLCMDKRAIERAKKEMGIRNAAE